MKKCPVKKCSMTERGISVEPSRKMSRAVCAGFLLGAVALSFGAPSVAAAGHRRAASAEHRPYYAYAPYRGPRFLPPPTLPYGPEYGFLTHVPPNAIRMPGYIFVPGKGILGAPCDLPSSACENQYRDVQ
jgi:hypothetical protein